VFTSVPNGNPENVAHKSVEQCKADFKPKFP